MSLSFGGFGLPQGGAAGGVAGSIGQNIQREKLNLSLNVTPHISSNDAVRLEIEQETKDIGGKDAELGPTWTERKLKTQVVVHDQQSVVIGGLIQERDIYSVSKVPLLGDIPLLGYLFKYSTKTKKKTNLLILLTPYIVKDQLDQIYTTNGGEFLNASTNEDSTNYFLRLPRNRLELWAWLESDRLLNPVFREFYSERDVVFEERRLRTESTPLGKYDEAFNATFWEASPYHWPVVGWASDIPSYTLAQAKDYFATYYAPNNLTGVLVGDFKTAEVKPLLERYFGRIPRGKTEPPPVVTMEPQHLAEKRFRAEAETSPTANVRVQSEQ